MIFPSSLFKGKDEKNEALSEEDLISKKDAEIAALRAELEELRKSSNDNSENQNGFFDNSNDSRAKRIPISIDVLRDILQNTFNRIDRNNKAPRYSILNLLNVINYTQESMYDKVPAMQEINYIKSYIEIKKHSTSNRPTLRFTFAPTLRRQLVHSGLFIPIVDYAFNNSNVGSLIDIKVLELESTMTMDIIMPQSKNANSAFMLLAPEFQKLKAQLNELYPNAHTFEVKSLASNIAIRLGIKYEKMPPLPRNMDEFNDYPDKTFDETDDIDD